MPSVNFVWVNLIGETPPPVRLLSINTEASPTGNSHFHHKETTLIAYLCMFRPFFYVVCRGSSLER